MALERRTARIEEIDDDPDEFDISEYDTRPGMPWPAQSQSLMNPTDIPSTTYTRPTPSSAAPQQQQQRIPQMQPPTPQTKFISEDDAADYKNFQSIYPLYWDKNRTVSQGRRVPLEYAVENPLATELISACNSLGLKSLFEPTKTHPKDWANPGRVKVELKVDGEAVDVTIPSKRQLYKYIGKFLQKNPTTEKTPLKFRFPNLPYDPSKPTPPVAVPKGWKMGTILPLHSPAVSGGGVSDNFLGDMMKEMGSQGGDMGGMAGMANMLGAMGANAEPEETKSKSQQKKEKRFGGRQVIRG
ncbi:signal recognition particle, SRP19 subunit [Ascobolus immersus RN42]|uniref:Signal recognition particle, SRP19 subunit n=1 Tax=Ascobolus immersus RN42 TaxID=1160509 RepID=A0A3N4HXT9_ASCIM|nr:signal recognition particle, SRP19 subunit [Ascobolus immersus RN42]